MPKDINGNEIDPADANAPTDVNQPERVGDEVVALGLKYSTDADAQVFIDAIQSVMDANAASNQPLQQAQQIIAAATPYLKLITPLL